MQKGTTMTDTTSQHHPELPPLPCTPPEPGFYAHYKHTDEKGWNSYLYEVLGVGHHTESDCRPEDEFMVAYRPLYESALVYRMGKLFDLRPLAMFMEQVDKPEYRGPRFTKITDPELIARLNDQRAVMYGV